MATTWRELEAQGVKRCCAMFINGGRCRRRAVEPFNGEWCAKHGPMIAAETAKAMRALKAQAHRDLQDDESSCLR